ncbi:hypothetical protein AOQ84DRAFT_392560 [Glonium stellatum]|uniref:Cyclin-like domain-containing protein n=1 Tax=Glonium stellatum TaxID=574774 RepID=A0A8E2EQN7_9PEZI|nr:hypothetical protein AOQ84DRAFT_392560 [Glonium stellatum]
MDGILDESYNIESLMGMEHKSQAVLRLEPELEPEPGSILACEKILRKYSLETIDGFVRDEITRGALYFTIQDTPITPEEENRACYLQYSRVHVLVCGHTILTNTATLCGKNCAAGSRLGARFGCRLCYRLKEHAYPFTKYVGLDRWDDLLLSDRRIDEEETKYLSNYRPCEMAIIARNGTIIPARGNSNIALIRLIDRIRLQTSQSVKEKRMEDQRETLKEAQDIRLLLDRICDAIEVPVEVQYMASYLFKITHGGKRLVGHSRMAVIAGCLYVACQRHKYSLTGMHICRVVNIQEDEMLQCMEPLTTLLWEKAKSGRKNFLGRPKPHLYRSEYVRHSILQWLRKLRVGAWSAEELLIDV